MILAMISEGIVLGIIIGTLKVYHLPLYLLVLQIILSTIIFLIFRIDHSDGMRGIKSIFLYLWGNIMSFAMFILVHISMT